jgi:hypothetical protein
VTSCSPRISPRHALWRMWPTSAALRRCRSLTQGKWKRIHCHPLPRRCNILVQGLIGLIPSKYIFFFRSLTVKNSEVKCAWPRTISEWVIDRKIFPDVHKWVWKCVEKTSVALWGLVYDPSELLGLTTTNLEVTEALQMVSELILTASRTHRNQLRRIW